jgi:phosphoribosylformimino-5-aminoimidazole carboxamide ribotide isomerase
MDVTIENGDDPVVQTHGWTESSNQTLWSLMDKFMSAGAYNFLCTDISKDGTLEGPNMALYAEATRRYPKARIIASGGLSSAAEFPELAATGVTSVVTGKALLDGHLTIEEIEQFLQSA